MSPLSQGWEKVWAGEERELGSHGSEEGYGRLGVFFFSSRGRHTK